MSSQRRSLEEKEGVEEMMRRLQNKNRVGLKFVIVFEYLRLYFSHFCNSTKVTIMKTPEPFILVTLTLYYINIQYL